MHGHHRTFRECDHTHGNDDEQIKRCRTNNGTGSQFSRVEICRQRNSLESGKPNQMNTMCVREHDSNPAKRLLNHLRHISIYSSCDFVVVFLSPFVVTSITDNKISGCTIQTITHLFFTPTATNHHGIYRHSSLLTFTPAQREARQLDMVNAPQMSPKP